MKKFNRAEVGNLGAIRFQFGAIRFRLGAIRFRFGAIISRHLTQRGSRVTSIPRRGCLQLQNNLSASLESNINYKNSI